jgi:multiple sugar transport system substrate-binding protein
MTFMNSAAAVKARLGNTPQVTARDDVNSQVLASDPLLSFIAKDVLPITIYRPSLSDYTKVSTALQNATDSVVNGTSAGNAAKTYEKTLEGIVGAGNVFK